MKRLAKRWLQGEALAVLAVEASVSWQTLAGVFTAAGYRAKDRSAVKSKAATEKWQAAAKRAARTHQWSIAMIRWLVSRLKSQTRWQLVTFTGPHGGDARGIVDMLAVRRNHRRDVGGLKRGDLFEFILIQAKAGTARRPDADDIRRLHRVRQEYGAKDVLLAEWHQGHAPVFSRLLPRSSEPTTAWEELKEPLDVFG
ncbi:MAG: hypothetical protein JNM56_11955 [Planctomycetia bacterium]|nr:hypothetical protein [Planctomycetia bacterium]